jgi:hypothetical protein
MKFAKQGIVRVKKLTKTACLAKVKKYVQIARSSKLTAKQRTSAMKLAYWYKHKAKNL